MIGFAVILSIAAVMGYLMLPSMLRKGEIRDSVVFSVLLIGGVVFSTLAASLISIPSPLYLLICVYKPFSQWIFSVMGWKG